MEATSRAGLRPARLEWLEWLDKRRYCIDCYVQRKQYNPAQIK